MIVAAENKLKSPNRARKTHHTQTQRKNHKLKKPIADQRTWKYEKSQNVPSYRSTGSRLLDPTPLFETLITHNFHLPIFGDGFCVLFCCCWILLYFSFGLFPSLFCCKVRPHLVKCDINRMPVTFAVAQRPIEAPWAEQWWGGKRRRRICDDGSATRQQESVLPPIHFSFKKETTKSFWFRRRDLFDESTLLLLFFGWLVCAFDNTLSDMKFDLLMGTEMNGYLIVVYRNGELLAQL